jgi:hypothetical protein
VAELRMAARGHKKPTREELKRFTDAGKKIVEQLKKK